jgi:hypothetical protein
VRATHITVEYLGFSLRTRRFGVCGHKSLSSLPVLPTVMYDAYSSKTRALIMRNKVDNPQKGFDMILRKGATGIMGRRAA